MAVVNSNEYDHIDVVAGSNTNRHFLKDATARKDVQDLKTHNAIDMMLNANHNSATLFSVSYAWNADGSCTVTGTASNTGVRDLLGTTSTIPDGFAPGMALRIKYSGTNVTLNIVEYVNGSVVSNNNYTADAEYRLNYNLTGLRIGFRVANGKTVNETVEPHIYNAMSNAELTEVYQYNVFDLLKDYARKSTVTTDITWTWHDDGTCTVTGTAASTRFIKLAGGNAVLPDGLISGGVYQIVYTGTNVGMHIIQYKNGTELFSEHVFANKILRVADGVTGIEIRLRVASGKTANETVKPVILNGISNEKISALIYNSNELQLSNIKACALTYHTLSETGFFTYGSASALDYDSNAPRQIHCGTLTALIIGGCSFYQSRYAEPNGENKLYTSGYGFDFCAYSLKRALGGDADEISYIGEGNLSKTVDELKRLELFKSSAQLCAALNRWGMLFDVTSGTSINESILIPGDIIFYGTTSGSGESDIVNGYHIIHCDVVIGYKNGVPWVIDGGSTPITLHQAVYNSGVDYRIGGRVPLGLGL